MAYPFQPMKTHTLKKLARLMKETRGKRVADRSNKDSARTKIITPETTLQNQVLNQQ